MINDIAVIDSELPTNIEEIREFEELIGSRLPEDYKQFLLKHNGGHPVTNGFKLIEPINEKTNEAGISWFFALYDGDDCNITNDFKRSRGQIPDEFLPIGYDSGGKICIGINGEDYGKLYYWTPNWSWWSKDDLDYLFLITNNFTDFINGLFEREIDDKGDFIRRYQDGTVTITPE